MYFVTKLFNPGKGYSCFFRQPLADTHCHNWHGYDLIFAVTLGADELDKNGWVFNFAGLKPVEERIKATFDHKWVIAEDDPLLNLTREYVKAADAMGHPCSSGLTILPRVGCEAFALWLAAETFDLLHAVKEEKRVRILHTKVYEHAANMAGYSPMRAPSYDPISLPSVVS